MTHSLDSFITDSANSATALYTGHKSSVNALGVYADSSPDPLDDPKIQSIAELFHEVRGGGVGIVSTAFIADATPGALTAHTRNRGQYQNVVDSFLNGVTSNYTWVNWTGPDVLFGGGAEQFIPSSKSFQGKDYYAEFRNKGYNVIQNNTALQNASNTQIPKTSPDGSAAAASDQPGLKDMTLKAIDILHKRNPDKGFFLMSEAASIDKVRSRPQPSCLPC
jgi:alkaline phosphatase